jgi:hypothetical protein
MQVLAQRGQGYGFRGGRGQGGRGQGHNPQFVADRDVFHYLLEHHDKITRKVEKTDEGIITVTESEDPKVAAKIQEHVASMYDRVKNVKPIHMRDPLFAALFRNADKIKMAHEDTERGVRVVETSEDPFVVKLLQAHADTVSLFIRNGFEEAHRNHAVPKADSTAPREASNGEATPDSSDTAKCPPAGDRFSETPCSTCKPGGKCGHCPTGANCPQGDKCPCGEKGCSGKPGGRNKKCAVES